MWGNYVKEKSTYRKDIEIIINEVFIKINRKIDIGR